MSEGNSPKPEGKCQFCGQAYEQHEEDRPNRPVPKMPCLGLKSGFKKLLDGAGNALGEAFENR